MGAKFIRGVHQLLKTPKKWRLMMSIKGLQFGLVSVRYEEEYVLDGKLNMIAIA